MTLRQNLRRVRREDPLHRSILAYLRRALPPEAAATLCHVPNGEYRNKVTAGILKGMGARAGVEDLQFVWRGRHYAIEVKPEGAYQSPAQKERQAAIEAAWGHYAVCRSIEDVAEVLAEWEIPTRISITVKGGE